jgi:hypothetical protein
MSTKTICDRCGQDWVPEGERWLPLQLPHRTDMHLCPICAFEFAQIVEVFMQKIPLRVVPGTTINR